MIGSRESLSAAVLVFILCGCNPATEYEEPYQVQNMKLKELGGGRAPIHDLRTMKELALQLVQGRPSEEPEHDGSTQQWIENSVAALAGNVMFPRWDSRRIGANDYEVRYTYTHIDNDYNIEKRGYSWVADVLQKVVGPKRILDSGDFPETDRQLQRSCTWEPITFEEDGDRVTEE